MAARYPTSTILRSALAAHVSLSAASLLFSAFGPSQLPITSTSTSKSSSSEEQPSLTSSHHQRDMASMCASLPWLDQLHSIVASMYTSGVTNCCGATTTSGIQDNNIMVQVQLGKDLTYENPLFSYAGIGEIERAYRGRTYLHPQSDVKTLLECIDVVASEDSICGGDNIMHSQLQQNHEHEQQRNSESSQLMSIPTSIKNNTSSPPKVEITYRLTQQYGRFFSVHSLLVVTVQVRRGTSEKVRKVSSEQVALPLATSGFTSRAAVSTVAAATGHSSPATMALTKAASKLVAATRGVHHSDAGHAMNGGAAGPLVAEVVRIEEQWNGVQLIHFAPFHWSRRFNGFVAGSAAFLLFQ